MRIYSLDIGLTTGVVVAEVRDEDFLVVSSLSWNILDQGSFFRKHPGHSLLRPDFVVTEFPVVNPLSRGMVQVKRAMEAWNFEVAEFLKSYDGEEPEYHILRPDLWKISPVLRFNPYQKAFNGNDLPLQKPTVHEYDAARMAWWYLRYRKGIICS